LNKWEIIKKTVSVCLFINSDVVLALSGENINFYGVVQDSAIRLVTPTVGVEPTPIGSLTPAVTETPLATPTQETLPSPSPSEFSTPTPSFTPDASPESTSTPFPSPLPFPMPDSTSTLRIQLRRQRQLRPQFRLRQFHLHHRIRRHRQDRNV